MLTSLLKVEKLMLLAVFTFLTHWSLPKNSLPLASQSVVDAYLT